jgi:UDP-N-acetylglucosamine diphosphorylase / glucose-1-phosphate thymidylyltransferase / UDP-N-acetylgalactosamine diphosphorylase / glucosamine-1-phosphate N-acetyltransferase / galactosamine-1-phosphate N-acetyltransferase
MQCVILAAGLGTRMRPLTDTIPKPLVPVCGMPLLEHVVRALPSAVDELILVIGYKGEMIREHCGEEYLGKQVTYIEQTEQNGTAKALWLCKDLIKGRFLLLFADDIHGKEDLARATSYTRSLLVTQVDDTKKFGIVVRNPDGTLGMMIEKPEHAPSNCASTGPMVIDEHIFEFEPTTAVKNEFYLPEVIERYAAKYPIAVVEQSLWIPVASPEDIVKAEGILGCT